MQIIIFPQLQEKELKKIEQVVISQGEDFLKEFEGSQIPKERSKSNLLEGKRLYSQLDSFPQFETKYEKLLPDILKPQAGEFDEKDTILKLSLTPVEEIKHRKDYTLGNYNSYYSYRCERKWQDPRIAHLEKDLFFNKNCLDVGCNDGTFSILVAIKYFPKNIVGVDIDYRLINKAISNSKFFAKQHKSQNQQIKIEETKTSGQTKSEETIKGLVTKLKALPKSFMISMGLQQIWENSAREENSVANSTTELVDHSRHGNTPAVFRILGSEKVNSLTDFEIKNRFPNNIMFRVENFIKDLSSEEKFDTILCLSVTKWIHLNWGDCGIRRLFKKIYDSLTPGGHFVLEPQEWKSYKKKKALTETFKENYNKIQLRPNLFQNYLVQRIGFELIQKIIVDPNNLSNQGFRRPIYIFKKSSAIH